MGRRPHPRVQRQRDRRLRLALDVPLGAFFVPPEDDGVTVRYLFRPYDGAGLLDMGDLMAMVMPDSESDSRTMDAYRRRLVAATGQYMGPSWTDDLDRWMTSMTPREIRAEEAEDLRADREALWRIAGKLGRMIDAYEKEGTRNEQGSRRTAFLDHP